MEMAQIIEVHRAVGREPPAEPHSAEPVAAGAIPALKRFLVRAAEAEVAEQLGFIGPPTPPALITSSP